MKLECHASSYRITAAERIVGRREHVTAVVSRRTDVAANHLRFVIEQVDDSSSQRKRVGHVEDGGQIKVMFRRDRAEIFEERVSNQRLDFDRVDKAPAKRKINLVEAERRTLRERELRLN